MRKAPSYPRIRSITLLERVLSMVLRSFEGSIFKSFDLYGGDFFFSVLESDIHFALSNHPDAQTRKKIAN